MGQIEKIEEKADGQKEHFKLILKGNTKDKPLLIHIKC